MKIYDRSSNDLFDTTHLLDNTTKRLFRSLVNNIESIFLDNFWHGVKFGHNDGR